MAQLYFVVAGCQLKGGEIEFNFNSGGYYMNCIFGLFDVLGFTSFCENCDSHTAERVLKIMDNFETEIPEILLHSLDSSNDVPQTQIDVIKNRLRWLTFSDTVFVAMPFEPSDHPSTLKFNLIFFTVLAAYINRRMFEIGLPLRGTVHVGDVIVSKRCFAGKAVMEAHILSKKCQVAATIVSDKTLTLFLEAFPERQGGPQGFHEMFKELVVEADIPIAVKQIPNSLFYSPCFETLKTLCWFFLEMGRVERFVIPSDLNAYVHGRFTAHGKKLSGDTATLKAHSTAKLFQNWKAASNAQYRQLVSMTAHSPAKQG